MLPVLLLLFFSVANPRDVSSRDVPTRLYVVHVPGKLNPQLIQIKKERHAVATGFGYPWEMRPDIFGFTDPPADRVSFPAEYEQMTGIILGWASYAFDHSGRLILPEFLEILRHCPKDVRALIVVERRAKPLVEKTLRLSNLYSDNIELISFPPQFPDSPISRTLDTIWIRDYGPQFVSADSSQGRRNLHVIDMSYYPYPWPSKSKPLGRVRDDSLPSRLATVLGFPAHRPALIAEGGDLMTDGAGTCFISDRLDFSNRALFSSIASLKSTLSQYYGCRRIIQIKGLKGEPTGHLDMLMTVLSPDTIALGEYSPFADSVNAERLDNNHRILNAAGYQVVRIPMPTPYSIELQRIWATFTNSIRINDRLLVPVYRNENFPKALRVKIQREESLALKRLRDAIPKVSVIAVPSDSVITAGGSLHCIVMNVPRVIPMRPDANLTGLHELGLGK